MNHKGNSVHWGIIGCGDVTEKKSGPAFNKVPHSRLVAVMRRNARKAEDYARRHGVPRWYSDAESLIKDHEVDAVYIATPPDTHLMYTRRCLEAGKCVYVEKPMVLNSLEAREMLQLAEKYANRIVVAHYRRWWPMFRKIKQLIEDGTIGKPLRVQLMYTRQPLSESDLQKPGVQWRVNPAISGGGLFHDLAPHQLDLLLYWFGEAESFTGYAYNHAGLYNAPDTVTGSIRFVQGVSFFGLWHFASPAEAMEDSVCIEGEKGSIRCSIFGNTDAVLKDASGIKSFSFEPPEHNQIYLIDQTVRFFKGELDNPCPVGAACTGIRIMDAFCASKAAGIQ